MKRAGIRIPSRARGGVLALTLLGGCAFAAPPPPVQDTRDLAVSPRVAIARAQGWLRAQQFRIDKSLLGRSGGRLAATRAPFDEGGYARCAWSFVMSGGAEPQARVKVIATPLRAGWTRVQARVDISLVNGQGDRAECASSGRLEREILTAVASSR